MKKNDSVIKVENLTKVFKLPHERYTTVKQHFVNIFNPKSFEKFKALETITLDIKRGEFFGIIGSNGSGKSTLLKILAGIYQPTSGEVSIKGSLSPFIELGVGFNPDLTARENIFLNAAILGLSKKETEEKFDKIIDFAELREFVDQKLKNFSSGMQVRLGFAIAIQAETDILLVDEVLAVGDANFQQKCFDTFYKLKKEGKTIIFVSHDQTTIEDFCDRVLVLSKGKKLFLGEAKEALVEYMRSTTVSDNLQDEASKKTQVKEVSNLKIENSSCLNSEGKKKTTFDFNEDIVTSFQIENPEMKDLNFGVSIHRTDGVYCFGASTFLDNIKLNNRASNISVKFSTPRLLPGSYYLVAGIFGKNDKEIFDFKDRVVYFRVVGTASGRGVSFIDHKWETNE